MNAIEKLKAANFAAEAIISNLKSALSSAPSAVEAREAELTKLTKADLIAQILELEKPKDSDRLKVETVAKAIMEAPACAVLTYEDIADLIKNAGVGEKTTSASIASYASKKKEEWNVVARERLNFRASDFAMAVNE